MIDDIDKKILNLLQDDGRIANSDIAKTVGLAPSATFERVKKLKDKGLISSFETRLNASKLGYGLVAFVFVRTDEPVADGAAGAALKSVPEIQEVYNVAGEDCYLCKIRVADTSALGQVLREKIGAIPSVTSTRTTVVLETYKETIRIPIEGNSASGK